MSKEVSRFDRLLRKRNQCLQKQLDVTVQIFDKEYKMCRSRVNNNILECNKFYRNIQGIYPGLESYSHPDIRSMVLEQEKKQKQAKFDIHKKSKRGNRYTVGDSRHIARTNQSQIQTNMYSTYTATNQSQDSEIQTSVEDIHQIIKKHEEKRISDEQLAAERVATKSSEAWTMKRSCSSSGSSTDSCTDTDDAQEKEDKEHPITTLVRSMRQRIYSAPANKKVQFHRERNFYPRPRPQTALGNIEEQNDIKLLVKLNNRPNSERPKTSTSRLRKGNEIRISKSHDHPQPVIPAPELMARWKESHPTRIEELVRRPKSAPPNYELLGKSPALPRQQVAGIIAELESRKAATRSLIERSRNIHRQVKRITAEQGISSDVESEDETS